VPPPRRSATVQTRHGQGRNADRGLSEGEVVNAALRLVKKAGVEALTMRRLADALDVTVGATYKHIDGKSELLQLVVDSLYARIEESDRDHEAPLDRVRVLLVRFYEVMSSYPGMAAYVATHPGSLGPRHLTETVGEALAEVGVPADRVESAMRVLFFYTSGALHVPLPNKAPDEHFLEVFAAGLDVVLAGVQTQLAR
jgi:AcrR family transcriptional regulator